MAGVEADEFFARDGVAEIEFVRADGIAFRADAEEFAFDGVEIVRGVERFGEDGIEGFGEAVARGGAIDGRIFKAVGNPDVGDAGGVEGLAEFGADAAAGDAVIDPEAADGRVVVREGETVGGFGMGEEGGIEIDADFLRAGPIDPTAEVGGFQRIALDSATGGVGGVDVAGVEVDAMTAGNAGEGCFKIGAEFLRCAGAAEVVAGNGQAAAELGRGVFEAADVVALPAVERNGNRGETLDGAIGIDAEFDVLFARNV